MKNRLLLHSLLLLAPAALNAGITEIEEALQKSPAHLHVAYNNDTKYVAINQLLVDARNSDAEDEIPYQFVHETGSEIAQPTAAVEIASHVFEHNTLWLTLADRSLTIARNHAAKTTDPELIEANQKFIDTMVPLVNHLTERVRHAREELQTHMASNAAQLTV